ncbi:SURF1 family protein [Pseudidiomarina taiwanensis]|uniref:SURF1 family protein n=1 Tax=Pseudidiomarina taiwanensis TaxID=337250 RepID=UPI0013006A70|nr:SURF1 family protein [Pseudidiomarina taiwanensis]
MLVISILVKLGFWQLDRAEQKRQLFADYAEQQLPLNLNDPTAAEPERYASVEISGQFEANRYFLLDNQILNGQVGYQVIGLLTPQPALSDTLVLVNLGWVPVGSNRAELPQLELPQGVLTIPGRYYQPSEFGFQLSDHILEQGPWPQRIQRLDIESLSELTQLPLAPYVVLLSEQAEFGWPRQWQPQVMAPEKHQAYALQWFSLALACVVVFIFASRSRTKTTEE